MKKRTFLSVRLMTYTGAVLIVALFSAITVANLLLTKGYYQPTVDEAAVKRLHDKSQVFSDQLDFFRQIVSNLAKQPTTQDILEFSDEVAAQRWATQVRRFIPQAIGVALLNENGKVLGEPASQQVGPLCLTDLAKLSQGEPVKSPPVHREIPDLAHFDLTAPVLDDMGNQVGIMFVSFSLATLQTILDNNTEPGQLLRLLDGNGEAIAETGRIKNFADSVHLSQTVAHSDWTLQFVEKPDTSLPNFLRLVIFNVSAFLLVIGIIALLTRYATRTVAADFGHLKRQVDDMLAGQPSEENPKPALRETEAILPSLEHIHQDLLQQRQALAQHSRSDELTQLANQRQFDEDFARAYGFARRGIPVCVALLRLQLPEQLSQETAEHVVKQLAKTLRESSRKIDLAARLEDDQFALLMFGMKEEGAMPSLKRLNKAFTERQERHPAIPKEAMGRLHCGYTLIHAHRDNVPADVLQRAEAALASAEAEDSSHIVAA